MKNYKDHVRLDTNNSPRYILQRNAADKATVLTVHLPYDCLREWHAIRRKCSVEPQVSYIDILNAFMLEKAGFKVRKDCKRIESRLERLFGEVKSKFVGKNGTSYRKLCLKASSLALLLEDLETLAECEKDFDNQKEKNKELKERYEDMVKYMDDERNSKVNTDAEIHKIREENNTLHTYVEGLGQQFSFQNYGRKLLHVGEHHQRRKLTELKSNVEKALWFLL